MLKQLKTFTTNMIAGANIATGIIMWLVGFSDYANPATHPYIATAGLVSIWFVAGALAALAGAVLGAELLVQVLLFAGVSAAALAVTRPLVRKYTRRDTVATNADRVLGSRAKVTETIDNDNSTGAVYVDGKTWTARSAEGDVIPAGEQVEVASIEGVKLLVIPVKEGGFVK